MLLQKLVYSPGDTRLDPRLLRKSRGFTVSCPSARIYEVQLITPAVSVTVAHLETLIVPLHGNPCVRSACTKHVRSVPTRKFEKA